MKFSTYVEHPIDRLYMAELDRAQAFDEAVDAEAAAVLLEMCEADENGNAHELRMQVYDAYVQDVAGVKSDDCRIVVLLLAGRISEAVELAKDIADSKAFNDELRDIAYSRVEARRDKAARDAAEDAAEERVFRGWFPVGLGVTTNF